MRKSSIEDWKIMDTHKLFMLRNHFDFIKKAFLSGFLPKTMFRLGNSFWVFLSTLVFNLFGIIIKHLSRSQVDDEDDDYKNDLLSTIFCHEQQEQILYSGSNFCEKENSEFYFGFKFLKDEDFNRGSGVTGSSVEENGLILSTSKYEFMPAKDFGGFVEEGKETISFTVEELFVGSTEDFVPKSPNLNSGATATPDKDSGLVIIFEEKVQSFHESSNDSSSAGTNSEVPSEKDLEKIAANFSEAGEFHEEKTGELDEEKAEESVDEAEEVFKVEEKLDFVANEESREEQSNWLGEFISNSEFFSHGIEWSPENQFHHPFDSNPESDNSSDGFSISPGVMGSDNIEFSLDWNENEELESEIKTISIKEGASLEGIDDEYIEFEPNLEKSNEFFEESMESDNFSTHKLDSNDSGEMKSWDFDSDEEDDELEEHQDLIEQLKMELKNARTGGLPTIMEECETPKMVEDLKPLRIDEKIEHSDRMAEIQKFYKSYAERMRKLDVLNYQTLQAISFLRLKHPDQLASGENTSFLAIKSLLLPNFWPCKLRRIYADPTLKSITEMQRDLEVVYVGQVCLSWEILRWQYGKAKELQEYDSHGICSYNQVAIEFQQFQVLVQRLTEDGPFQGPRVQHYVQKRCILRSLLQVPTIKDDCLKDKKGRKEHEEDAVSIAMLAERIEESMRVFWEFVHADKDYSNLILCKVLQGARAYLQDPADTELLMDIKTSLHKKDRRLKDILRTGNCIVKKFQKQQGGLLDYPLFVSQVELRLVSRVLSLPRLTRDQLVWCQNKLNNINFVDRSKIRVEPLFLLFPC